MGDVKEKVKGPKREKNKSEKSVERYVIRMKDDDAFYDLDQHRTSPKITFVHRNVPLPTFQIGMLPGEYLKELNKRQGDCFECYIQAMYGGELSKRYSIQNGSVESLLMSQIDLVDDEGNFREVKSIEVGARVRLMDRQVSRTAYLLATHQDLPHYSAPDAPRVMYDVIRHDVEDIKKRFGTGKDRKDLVFEFGKKAKQIISLDYSLIFGFWDPRSPKIKRQEGYFYRDGSHYDPLTFLHGSTLNMLLKEPEKALEKRGLDPRDYSINLGRTPDNIIMGDESIKDGHIIWPSIPTTTITTKDPEEWIYWLRSQDLSWLPKYFEFRHPSEPDVPIVNKESIDEEEVEEQRADDGDSSFDFGSKS